MLKVYLCGVKIINVDKSGNYQLGVSDVDIQITAGAVATVKIVPPIPYSVNRERSITILPAQSVILKLNATAKNWEVRAGVSQATTIPVLQSGKVLSNDGKNLLWAADVSIYNSDGVLTSNRVVTQSGHDLDFSDGNFSIVNKGTSSNFAGITYTDEQAETTGGIFYDSDGGKPFYVINNLDVTTNNEASITVQYDRVRLAYLDFAVNPDRKIGIEVLDVGVLIEGNANDSTPNTEWAGHNGVHVTLAKIFNNGNWQWHLYPNTRDDSATTPVNFLYTDVDGNILSAPLVGSLTQYIAKTALYTLTASDYTVDCTANTFALTLPTAVGREGKVYNLKNSGTGVITINTTSSQTIDASASGAITLSQWDNLTVQSTGANWIIL